MAVNDGGGAALKFYVEDGIVNHDEYEANNEGSGAMSHSGITKVGLKDNFNPSPSEIPLLPTDDSPTYYDISVIPVPEKIAIFERFIASCDTYGRNRKDSEYTKLLRRAMAILELDVFSTADLLHSSSAGVELWLTGTNVPASRRQEINFMTLSNLARTKLKALREAKQLAL